MASAKIVTRGPNKDGTISIAIQIIHNRSRYPRTIARVPEKDWDEKKREVRSKHPDFAKLNQLITRELQDAKEYILDCSLKKIPVDPETYLRSHKIDTDIISRLEAKAESCRSYRTAIKYKTCARRITEANMNASIHHITRSWVKKFDDYLYSVGNNQNTRAKYLKAVGSVFTDARHEGEIVFNPFDGYKKSTTPGKKAKLSMAEFVALRTATIPGELEAVRRLFVFAIQARGMRAFDALTLQWPSLQDGRLTYRAEKSPNGKEGKEFDILITEDMAACLGEPGTGYVFPFVTKATPIYGTDPERNRRLKENYQKHVASRLAIVNLQLKDLAVAVGIKKHLTMHVARHTFSHLMDESGVPLGMIQNLLGHGDITTTKIYVESIRRTDEMDEVVGRVF